MRRYTISKKKDWAQVPVLDIDQHMWHEDIGIEAHAQLCYDDRALYVRLFAKEEHIRAMGKLPTDNPWLDSCLEFFFAPVNGLDRYFNIEFNPNACMFLGFGKSRDERVRMLPMSADLRPQPCYTQDGWEITYEVPCSLIRLFCPGFTPRSGDSMRANCFKCGDETVIPHFYSWNECTSPEHTFHTPDDFGLMIFE